MSIHSSGVMSFKINPEAPNSDDYRSAIEFHQEEQLVSEFFQAIVNHKPYNPQHDRALAQWGMQIVTNGATVKIGCYIPDLTPEGVVGVIRSDDDGFGYFQSHLLLHWYQKYGHYWQVGDYQRVQYGRVMAILKPISQKHVTSFTIISDLSESSEERGMHEFVKETACVTAFFQALEDMRFAAPTSQNYLAGWTVQIRTGATTVKLTCSIPAEEPTLVIGLIDSGTGYTYFQSRHLYQWYQNYKDRWLNPDEAHPPEHTGNEDGDLP